MEKPIIFGKPEEDKPDERNGFYVHKHLVCYLDPQPDGVYVEGKTPQGKLLFRGHTGNVAEAMDYIDSLKELCDAERPESDGTRQAR